MDAGCNSKLAKSSNAPSLRVAGFEDEDDDENEAPHERSVFEKLEGFLLTRCFTERMDDDQLKEKLASWEVRPEIPRDFQRSVWQKIAVRESKPKLSFFGGWDISWLRPARLATCAIILGGLAGTRVGLFESSQAKSRNWENFGAKYVQSLDPYEQLPTL